MSHITALAATPRVDTMVRRVLVVAMLAVALMASWQSRRTRSPRPSRPTTSHSIYPRNSKQGTWPSR
jgi:hypothetical protein